MTLAQRIARVRFLVLDVDGVLTDGRVVYDDEGRESKAFHARDGMAIKLWQGLGFDLALISGRTSKSVEIRAAELGIVHVMQGISDKRKAIESLAQTINIDSRLMAAIGDDLIDLPMLRSVGVGIAVADACEELRDAADHVTMRCGGQAAVREAIEWLVKSMGRWHEVVAKFERV